MYQDNYEPQHPMLKQMRAEQSLMDSLPEPMRISSDVFEASAGCPAKGGFMGIGSKWDENSIEYKTWSLFYQYYGHLKRFGGKEGLKAFGFLQSRFNGVCEIPMADIKKRKPRVFSPKDKGYPKTADEFLAIVDKKLGKK